MKGIKKIAEYMNEHPICGFNLVDMIDDDFNNDGVMETLLRYRFEDDEGVWMSVFGEEHQGQLIYQTFIPQHKIMNRQIIRIAFALIAKSMGVQPEEYQLFVLNSRNGGIDGYSTFVVSEDGKYSKEHEYKLISAIIWSCFVSMMICESALVGDDAA